MYHFCKMDFRFNIVLGNFCSCNNRHLHTSEDPGCTATKFDHFDTRHRLHPSRPHRVCSSWRCTPVGRRSGRTENSRYTGDHTSDRPQEWPLCYPPQTETSWSGTSSLGPHSPCPPNKNPDSDRTHQNRYTVDNNSPQRPPGRHWGDSQTENLGSGTSSMGYGSICSHLCCRANKNHYPTDYRTPARLECDPEREPPREHPNWCCGRCRCHQNRSPRGCRARNTSSRSSRA